MKLKYTLGVIISITTLLAMSCTKIDEPGPEKNIAYRLQSIQWKLSETDKVEIVEQKLPKQVFMNNELSAKDILIVPLENMKETSYFGNENKNLFCISGGDTIFITIPAEYSLLKPNYSYFIGGRKAPLSAGKEILLKPTISISSETQLAPNTKLLYNATIYYNRVTAIYKAVFVAEDDSDYQEVEGKWTGLFYSNVDSEIFYSDLE